MMDFQRASNLAEGIDKSFYLIIGIDIFFFVLLITLMLIFVFRYSRKRHPNAVQIKEHTWLELTWLVVPLILVLFMFFYTYKKYLPTREVPKDAMNITAIARMWSWEFVYPNGKSSDKLYLPIDKAIKLNLKATDVVHSIYIPAFRLKEDMVPGKDDNYMWFIPTRRDTFEVFCTEYCGVRHSYMLTKAIVLDSILFDEWLAKVEIKKGKDQLPGFEIVKSNSCIGCHSTDGSRLVGPSFKDIFGQERLVETPSGEKKLTVDEAYIKRAINEPDAEIVKGYNKGLMRSYKEVLKDEDIDKIVEYLKAKD